MGDRRPLLLGFGAVLILGGLAARFYVWNRIDGALDLIMASGMIADPTEVFDTVHGVGRWGMAGDAAFAAGLVLMMLGTSIRRVRTNDQDRKPAD